MVRSRSLVGALRFVGVAAWVGWSAAFAQPGEGVALPAPEGRGSPVGAEAMLLPFVSASAHRALDERIDLALRRLVADASRGQVLLRNDALALGVDMELEPESVGERARVDSRLAQLEHYERVTQAVTRAHQASTEFRRAEFDFALDELKRLVGLRALIEESEQLLGADPSSGARGRFALVHVEPELALSGPRGFASLGVEVLESAVVLGELEKLFPPAVLVRAPGEAPAPPPSGDRAWFWVEGDSCTGKVHAVGDRCEWLVGWDVGEAGASTPVPQGVLRFEARAVSGGEDLFVQTHSVGVYERVEPAVGGPGVSEELAGALSGMMGRIEGLETVVASSVPDPETPQPEADVQALDALHERIALLEESLRSAGGSGGVAGDSGALVAPFASRGAVVAFAGDSAWIKLRTSSGAVRAVRVALGEEVAEGWRLESFDARSGSVRIVHESLGSDALRPYVAGQWDGSGPGALADAAAGVSGASEGWFRGAAGVEPVLVAPAL